MNCKKVKNIIDAIESLQSAKFIIDPEGCVLFSSNRHDAKVEQSVLDISLGKDNADLAEELTRDIQISIKAWTKDLKSRIRKELSKED